MKYVDEDGELHTLIADKQSFKGVENYFIDALLNTESAEIDPLLHDGYDSGNEVDTKFETFIAKQGYELLVMNLEDLDVNDTNDDAGEWEMIENLLFTYLSGIATDSVPSDTSTDADSLLEFEILTIMHLPIRSSMMLRSSIENIDGAMFKVPAC